MKFMDGINNFPQVPPNTPKSTDIPQKTGETAPPTGAPPSTTGESPTQSQPAATFMPAEVLAETLLGYGYKATEENKAMLKLMLENGLPLTKESVARMNQALKLTQTPQKALFMLQNNIKLTDANANLLEKLVSGQSKITNKLATLTNVIEQVKDPEVKAQLKQILSGGETAKTTGEAVSNTANESAQTQAATNEASGETASKTTQPTTQQPAPQQPTQTQSPAQPQSNLPVQPQPFQSTQPPTQAQPSPAQSQTPPTSQLPTTQPQHPTQALAPQHPTQSTPQQPTQTSQTFTPQQPTETQSQPPIKNTSQPTPPLTQNNAEQAQLAKAYQELQTIQGTKVAARLAKAANATPPAEPLAPPPIPKNLLFSVQQSTPQSLENYIHNLRDTLTQITQALNGNDSLDAFRVLAHTRSIEASLDFSSHIRDQIFVQVPISYNGHTAETTLHVYRDPKKKASSDSDSASALIALDTAALGHFETFVQKTAQSVRCQFRLENEDMVGLVRENIHKLGALLQESGYSLDAFTFLPPGAPYTVLSGSTDGNDGGDSSDGLLRYNRLV